MFCLTDLTGPLLICCLPSCSMHAPSFFVCLFSSRIEYSCYPPLEQRFCICTSVVARLPSDESDNISANVIVTVVGIIQLFSLQRHRCQKMKTFGLRTPRNISLQERICSLNSLRAGENMGNTGLLSYLNRS
jgi:hypothetical protein